MRLPESATVTIGNGHVVTYRMRSDPENRSLIMVSYTFPDSLKRELRKAREYARMFRSCDGNRRRQARRL